MSTTSQHTLGVPLVLEHIIGLHILCTTFLANPHFYKYLGLSHPQNSPVPHVSRLYSLSPTNKNKTSPLPFKILVSKSFDSFSTMFSFYSSIFLPSKTFPPFVFSFFIAPWKKFNSMGLLGIVPFWIRKDGILSQPQRFWLSQAVLKVILQKCFLWEISWKYWLLICNLSISEIGASTNYLTFVSSVRSSYSHPYLLLTHHPLFQITPVLNTGLSLSEPLQLYKGYNAI